MESFAIPDDAPAKPLISLPVTPPMEIHETPRYAVDNLEIAVEPTEIGYCFRRGFRPDSLALCGEVCFLTNQEKYTDSGSYLCESDSVISFSERQPPVEFLLGLGFSVDEATAFMKDNELNGRLQAGVAEARVWVNRISKTQGTLLFLLAYKAKPKVMRYYLQLVEAIINNRIHDAVKLDGFLRILEKVEDGQISLISIFGTEKIQEDEDDEGKIKRKEMKAMFLTLYKMALEEATAIGKTALSKPAINLLRHLTTKFKQCLNTHLQLLATLIGQQRMTNDVQLEAAMIYLSRMESKDVKLHDFEEYCGLPHTCSEDYEDKRYKDVDEDETELNQNDESEIVSQDDQEVEN